MECILVDAESLDRLAHVVEAHGVMVLWPVGTSPVALFASHARLLLDAELYLPRWALGQGMLRVSARSANQQELAAYLTAPEQAGSSCRPPTTSGPDRWYAGADVLVGADRRSITVVPAMRCFEGHWAIEASIGLREMYGGPVCGEPDNAHLGYTALFGIE